MGKWNSIEEAYRFVIKYFVSGSTDVSRSDIREALDYCVAEKNANAHYLAYALDYDETERNGKSLSLDNLWVAAENGIPGAQYDLGLHLFYGENVEKNILLALTWMEQAATQGYLEACRTLIRLYTHDSRVRRNPERASFWQDKLDGGSLADRFSLYPLSERDIRVDAESTWQEQDDKSKTSFAKLFTTVKQDVVIEAPYRTNMIVNAGPGTGKTYTLIQRIAHLVKNENIDPSKIVVFSFTRAVVKEIRNKVEKKFENDSAASRKVDISTFHKNAYAALQFANKLGEFDDWEKVDLDISRMMYEDCMVKGAELLEKHPEIIADWEYIIIDEIQDINHAKAYFVLQLLEACRSNQIPYLLLGDSCQAIYDYLDTVGIRNSAGIQIKSLEFYKKVINNADESTRFYSFDINENYRSVEKIKLQALPLRNVILSDDNDTLKDTVVDYKNSIVSLDFEEIEAFVKEHSNDKICLLEWKNIHARYISTKLKKRGVQNQCVLNIQRDAYPRWIGEVFGGCTEDSISEEVLKKLFLKSGKDVEDARVCWNETKKSEHVKSEIIPMKTFLLILLAHNLDDLFLDELDNNLIVSNVHRSKGLEYDYVLIDNGIIDSGANKLENARVLYVAMTRAKKETINLKNASLPYKLKTDKGRNYKWESISKKKLRLKYIEIGHVSEKTDAGPEDFVISDMMESQRIIGQLKVDDEIELIFSEEEQRYVIMAHDKAIGMMKEAFSREVKKHNYENYPKRLKDIFVDGIYTYIGQPNSIITNYEKKAAEYCPEIGVYRIWNYVSFSGLARAVYDE